MWYIYMYNLCVVTHDWHKTYISGYILLASLSWQNIKTKQNKYKTFKKKKDMSLNISAKIVYRDEKMD